jgi:hypothetical protein
VSAAAAAAPMLLSTAYPLFFVKIFDGTNLDSITLWTVAPVWWMMSTGFDALAGYTFGKVVQNQGNATIAQINDSY